MKKYGIIILAAGASRRLGSPKQLLLHQGQSLLVNTIETARESLIGKVAVVLGAHIVDIFKKVPVSDILVIENKNWAQGMASSIAIGLTKLLAKYPELDGVIFMVCDQPFANPALLQRLITMHEQTKLPIIISQYNDGKGIPAFFAKKFFPELLKLKGDTGAKLIIQQYRGEVGKVAFPKGDFDIDTIAAYEKLQQKDYHNHK